MPVPQMMVPLNSEEIAFLANAINEAIECVEDWEFETRVGYSKEEALVLHKKLSDLI